MNANITVTSRSGENRSFDSSRIERAILGASMEVNPDAQMLNKNKMLASSVTSDVVKAIASNGIRVVSVEEIQDLVEQTLMKDGHFAIARAYIVYRTSKAQKRSKAPSTKEKVKTIRVDNGEKQPFDSSALIDRLLVSLSKRSISNSVELAEQIASQVYREIYDGISESDYEHAVIGAIRCRVEIEPELTYVAASVVAETILREVADTLGVAPNAESLFDTYVKRGVSEGMLDAHLSGFDLKQLSAAIDHDLDDQFTLVGIQTLYDRYLLKTKKGKRYELPQFLFMRVAMGLALKEDDPNGKAIEFYNLLSSFDYMSSTPTLFNSGTVRPQLSSCYLTTIPDDLGGIYDGIKQNALLSKFAGGLGNDWTPVRSLGAYIKGTNGKSQGVIPFLKVANDTAVAVNQGGKRKGAVCAYLETWHADIEEFLELRKNTGDDRRRTHDMNTANWIPDLFMERVFKEETWSLFSPDEVPELHDLYGSQFEKKYLEYEEMGKRGELFVFKQIPALTLWRKMLQMSFETGHPWITFKDPCNIRSPQQHIGVVHSSNLCTEITLVTSSSEIAVCNLGSVNLPNHVVDGKLDVEKLRSTVRTAMRMLDNVIDINYYSVVEARNANLRHRPVGLGIMGFQDALYKLDYPYASAEAVEFADKSMEAISYFAIEASAELAQERGSYDSFDGSLWSKGVLPIDSAKILVESRSVEITMDLSSSAEFDWDALRKKIIAGMRNSNCLAIAPTATISNICGVSQSIEPTYQNLYVKSNLSGEFTTINSYLVAKLKELGLWNRKVMNDLKFFDGSVQSIENIPDKIKKLFRTAFEVESQWLIESASRRQKWLDQSQSLNLYIAGASGKKIDEMYRLAWMKGLKTTYYLRALGATTAEKSTGTAGTLNAVKTGVEEQPKACGLDGGECEACQ
jgi:ribonucleoside-diphosphate reductase alpha chain